MRKSIDKKELDWGAAESLQSKSNDPIRLRQFSDLLSGHCHTDANNTNDHLDGMSHRKFVRDNQRKRIGVVSDFDFVVDVPVRGDRRPNNRHCSMAGVQPDDGDPWGPFDGMLLAINLDSTSINRLAIPWNEAIERQGALAESAQQLEPYHDIVPEWIVQL